jgi:hypothetical protein
LGLVCTTQPAFLSKALGVSGHRILIKLHDVDSFDSFNGSGNYTVTAIHNATISGQNDWKQQINAQYPTKMRHYFTNGDFFIGSKPGAIYYQLKKI